MDISLLVALEGGAVKKCAMTDMFVLSEALYFSAADEEMLIMRRLFCFL